MEHSDPEAIKKSIRTYLMIGAALYVFTVITVAVNQVHLAVPDLEALKLQKEALLDQARNQKRQSEEARNVAGKELQEAEKQEKRYAADYAYVKLTHERVSELVRRGSHGLNAEGDVLF